MMRVARCIIVANAVAANGRTRMKREAMAMWIRVLAAIKAGETGFSVTQTYARIDQGLLPPPVRLGGNAKAFIEAELNAVNRALAAGADDDAIKQLVKKLVAARSEGVAA